MNTIKNILSFIFIIHNLFAQTGAEIKQAKNLVKTMGLSKSEAIEAAKSKGYTDSQINKVIESNSPKPSIELNEIKTLPDPLNKNLDPSNNNKLKNEDKQNIEYITDDENLPVIDDSQSNLNESEELSIESKNQNLIKQLQFFGYDIFKSDPELFQQTSVGAVDPNYLIGPGDEIIVMMWGETQFREVLTTNREGFIFIPEIGQVFVNGLNLRLLESKLYRVLSQSYASLTSQSGKATSFLDVSLGNLRPLRIQVLGEVSQPGAYTVSPSATLFSSLYYFQGPTTLGSLRDIRLIRGDKEISSIDFYDYLLTGKKPKDQKLQLDDIVFIPKRLKTISIDGEVNRPGIYELKSDETLLDILEMSGGLKITAYLDRAQIDRIVPFGQRSVLGMDRMITDVNLDEVLNEKNLFKLQDGDKIQIFSVLDVRQNIVQIDGSVTRPGSYDLGKGLTLSVLINKADSLLGDAYLERVDIVRINSDFSEELIKLNLTKALSGDPEHDIELRSLDRVRVYGLTEMIPKTFVSISGFVKKPGKYILQENMTLYDLIFMAGGFIDEEFKKLTYLKRAELIRKTSSSSQKEIIPFNLGLVLNKQNLAMTSLKPDDLVRVYSIAEVEGETRYVSIGGHVKRPGKYELYEANMTLYDLVFRAGGFNDEEFKRLTYLKRAELIRKTNDNEQKEIIPFNLKEVLNKQGIGSELLKSDDFIRVYSLEEIKGQKKYISITGHVKRPGSYELYETNMTLHDLLFKSGGFDDPTHLKNTFMERADLIRFDDDMISKTTIPFNLSLILENKQSESNFILQPEDEIIVYSKRIFNAVKTVTINGAIENPGAYDFRKDMNLIDLILEAGGISKDLYRYKVEIARIDPAVLNDDIKSEIFSFNMTNDFSFFKIDNQKKTSEKYDLDFPLFPYDYISVRPDPYFSMQKKVIIEGQVYYPGTYSIVSASETVYDIIKRSGGLRPNANLEGIKYLRNDKNISIDLKKVMKRKKSSQNLTVQDGDKITIFARPDMIEITGEVSSPGFYKFVKGQKVSDAIKNAGGLTLDAEKNGIYIKYLNGRTKKYKPWISNPRIKDGSVITINTKKDEEPIDKTELAKEIASILANIGQALMFISVSNNN